jgi:hypothetical protein
MTTLSPPPFFHATRDDEIKAEIVALQGRMMQLNTKLKDRKAMKYALECLPDLIGEQDFKDLCLSIGVGEAEITGQKFASLVREHVLNERRRSDQHHEKLRQAGLV